MRAPPGTNQVHVRESTLVWGVSCLSDPSVESTLRVLGGPQSIESGLGGPGYAPCWSARIIRELNSGGQAFHCRDVVSRPCRCRCRVPRIAPSSVQRKVGAVLDGVGHVAEGVGWCPVQPQEVRWWWRQGVSNPLDMAEEFIRACVGPQIVRCPVELG